MTLDDKMELATIMADIMVAEAEQAKATLAIIRAARDHISDELCHDVLEAGKRIQKHYKELSNLMRLSDAELSSRH